YTTPYDKMISTTTIHTRATRFKIKINLAPGGFNIANLTSPYKRTSFESVKFSYEATAPIPLDISTTFDRLENDTQMRYASNNDADFVMKNNSMFNQNNQSGLNLVIGLDGLVYNIVPNVSSGAGLPTSNNLDDSQTYMQSQPSYTSGNANGITGA